ncbi:MAG: STN domain-containing protein [Bacteroidales bacterium]
MKKIFKSLQLYQCCKKRLITMRYIAIVLLMSVTSILPTTAHSQPNLLSFDMKDVSIKEVLEQIEKSNDMYFLYNSQLIDVEKKVNITAKDEKVQDILSQLFDANVLVAAADVLASRFRPKAGVIQSWDTTPDMGWISQRGWDMPVIIDNMMNLDLLFKATMITGDSVYFNIAVKHAETTMKNHFRNDASSYHVVDYDSKTGSVRSKQTAQGYADNSSWARGQAWGLYGFTQTYINTGNKKFLEQAVRIADYIMNNPKIPKNLISYWDYDAPDIPNAPTDASSAAITASALFSLMQYMPAKKKVLMKNYAEKIIRELTSNYYLATIGTNHGFILKHSVGNIHTGEEDDKPLNYADYYLLEALTKWKNI